MAELTTYTLGERAAGLRVQQTRQNRRRSLRLDHGGESHRGVRICATLPSTPSRPATQLGGRLRHARGVSSQVCEVRPIAPGVRLRECACTARPWRIVLSLLRCRAPVMVIQRP